MVGRATSCPPLGIVIAMLALAPGSLGCQFSPSGQIGGDGGAEPVPDARRVDAAVGDAREPDARADDARPPDARPPDAAVLPPADVLVSRDVLTRYFIDESNSGSGVAALQDSAANPLDLTIDYAGAAVFVEEVGNRGLRWNALTEQGRASALVDASSKIRQELDGSTQGTIEVVVDIDQFVAGSRISHIGEADDRGLFTLRLEQDPTPRVRFILNNDDADENVWDVNMTGRGRTVLHLVLDTTRGNDDERAMLYVDGQEQQSAGSAPITRDEEIVILSEQPSYVLGNSTDGNRGVLGTIFYAAMYSTALDSDEVAHNADILLVNDDAPGN
jgi:hypothetical protein